jgi:hypothetical protein
LIDPNVKPKYPINASSGAARVVAVPSHPDSALRYDLAAAIIAIARKATKVNRRNVKVVEWDLIRLILLCILDPHILGNACQYLTHFLAVAICYKDYPAISIERAVFRKKLEYGQQVWMKGRLTSENLDLIPKPVVPDGLIDKGLDLTSRH